VLDILPGWAIGLVVGALIATVVTIAVMDRGKR
jgi:hypothetical protein